MAVPNDPITREEQYLASMAGQEVDLPQPITRVEKYLAKASGMDVETPDPITREEKYLDAIAEGGGGSSVTVEPLTVTENGTTTAPSGKAYSPVTTNVPNSYGAADEGKVVNNGALVAQTAHATVTANGTIDTTLNNSVTVNVQGGGSSVPSKDVDFIDYDGTITNSYTAAEFAALTAMPDNPSHDGLTSQGWNWSLSDAQTYVAKYGGLIIGQMYITDDGKTRIYIHLEEGRLAPYLGIGVNGTAVIDWGDGSETNTVTGTSDTTVINTQHTYAAAGDYVIIIDVTGNMTLLGHNSYGSQLLWKNSKTANWNRVYQNAVRRVEIGSNTTIGNQAFSGCYSLSSVTIPDGVTTIGSDAFYNCYSLSSVTIPDSVTTIGSSMFYNCYSLSSVTIPDGVTTIGSNAFYNCYSLSSVTIPDSVTTIGSSMFYNCYSLSSVTIPDSVTTIGSSMFYNCYSLSSVTIPDGVTTIGNNAFYNCYSLSSVTIPDSVTTIGSNAFYNCYSLSSVTIPDSVTTIGSSMFSNCNGLGFIRFESTIPPTVANSNAFLNLTTDCIIYVPSGTLSDYTSATNYPSSSTYTYVEY